MFSGNVIILEEVPATVWCGWTQETFCPLDKYYRSRSIGSERQPLLVKRRSCLNLSSTIFCLECKLNILLSFILPSLNLVHTYLLLLCAFEWMVAWEIPLETFDLSRAWDTPRMYGVFFAELYPLLLSFRLNSLAVWVTFWICGPHWPWREQNYCLRMTRYLFVEKCNQIWWM